MSRHGKKKLFFFLAAQKLLHLATVVSTGSDADDRDHTITAPAASDNAARREARSLSRQWACGLSQCYGAQSVPFGSTISHQIFVPLQALWKHSPTASLASCTALYT